MSELYDHPQPITCTCGHAFGHHDAAHPLYACTRCDCPVYFTDWPRARALGFEPAPHTRRASSPRPYRSLKARSPKWPGAKAAMGSARERWKAYRRETDV